MPSAVYRIEIEGKSSEAPERSSLVGELREAGLAGLENARQTRLYLIEGELSRADAERVARELILDPVTESAVVCGAGEAVAVPAGCVSVEVHLRPGVMDPVAETTLAELRGEGVQASSVRTARRYLLTGRIEAASAATAVTRVLANDCIERVVPGSAGAERSPQPPRRAFELRHVAVRELKDAELEQLSRHGHLFLSLDEMLAIQRHFRELGREPTDLELETLAQTWSEHCVHKTLKSAVVYRGAALPGDGRVAGDVEIRFENLLKDTIARATQELIAARRGPECLSVFKDNAGIIGFDADYGVAFKVETHNRPSAIEPYGGAATGIGGCIRDVLGCGLGARPIANTDVFCVAPSDWPADGLPRGVLHPRRVLRQVVRGVADYGNRMGIPTVNGAVKFDPRYLGNPLVYCGCVGLIPRDRIRKQPGHGDAIVVIGGRTGRDGIHGATFSSAELTDTHADEFSHAVQIGNAITEKRVADAVLAARDHASGCLFSAITDCGAGGLSSAVGEMAESLGAAVDLERVPLKYAGLRYDEIWISEAQERMVLAVPPANLDAFLHVMRDEEVEATVIGRFGSPVAGAPRLIVRFDGSIVGDLDMRFVHDGLPRRERRAEWRSTTDAPRADARAATADALLSALRCPDVASKAWIIRKYDHEVQGGSVVKPLVGRGAGPADAAVLRPRLDSPRGIALGCGLAPEISHVDPYWSAAAAIDEAICNVVCVGGDPARTAILDNFCWPRCDDPREMGGLVRACRACYDAALALGAPFVSGKDSLSNEFVLDPADIEPLIRTLTPRMANAELAALTAADIRHTGRLRIPGTLLISAVSLIDDVRSCVTADLKPGAVEIMQVGGQPRIRFSFEAAHAAHLAVAQAIREGLVAAAHDCSSGWLVALAEMCIGGDQGVVAAAADAAPFEPLAGGFVVQARDARRLGEVLDARSVPWRRLARVASDGRLTIGECSVTVAELRSAWRGETA